MGVPEKGRLVDPSTELQKFGISEAVTRSFGSESAPELVDYLDLLPSAPHGDGLIPLDGAVEHNQRSVLYYVADNRLSNEPTSREKELLRINKSIASRGDRAFLAIVKPGRLEVSPVRLGDVSPNWQEFKADSQEAINFYSNLVHGKIPGQESVDSDLVFDEMYKLLLTGADEIAHKIGRDNVLSLVGRALFFRFLCDRRVITENDCAEICATAKGLRACFDNSENTYRTSKWLDDTFNGHFLPFRERGTRQFFDGLNRSKNVFLNLKAIVRGLEPLGKSQYQFRFDWAAFDFAHVPVGLLSQVYEAFSWKWDPRNAEETSVHYTPRNIAVTLVEEAFAALPDPHKTRVLDPACGACVFLVLAFRRLYAEHWRVSRKRPDTKTIRKILETQLCGFDISESALRLGALSLYLTAIELDPNPIPPAKLKYKNLDGLVLLNKRTNADPEEGPVLGSIRPEIENKFNGNFDLILCNPPWSVIDDAGIVASLDSTSKEIVSAKDQELGESYQNPRGEPDLPFVWKATQWCRPGGLIAMVLPARILFRQTEIATQARISLFRLIRFTGIVNCSNVRKTKVWPDMEQPFMLAFAKNETPDDDSRFWFVSPQADFSMNSLGELRIDAHAAHVLSISEVINESWLLKSLAIGSWLDAEVVRKIRSCNSRPLIEYWQQDLGLSSTQGYKVQGAMNDASLLRALLDLGSPKQPSSAFTVDPTAYKNFDHETLDRTRLYATNDPLRVYRAPLFLLKKSLPPNRESGNSLTSYVDIAFNQSFYGYSACGNADAELLVRYLHVFAHSNLWIYLLLVTSPTIGTERPVFLKSDFDSCGVIPLSDFPESSKRQLALLSKRLEAGDKTTFAEIDNFIASLFGLSKRDVEVMVDTLTVRNPHDELGVRGSAVPTRAEVMLFSSELGTAIRPFAKKVGIEIKVNEISGQSEKDAFRFLRVSATEMTDQSANDVRELILGLAEQTGATLIIQERVGDLLIGILNQYRYWTKSRARLLAADILRDHFSKLGSQQR